MAQQVDDGRTYLNRFHFFSICSIGTTMFWVAMETHPELNEKIELMVNYKKRISLTRNENVRKI